jgi:hypothetical protein
MPPRLVVKKRLASSDVSSEEPSVVEKPKKRLVKRVVKKVESDPIPSEPVKEEAVKEEMNPLSAYTSSLNDFDRKVMEIAKDHLGTSFCMEKSVGYIEYLSAASK